MIRASTTFDALAPARWMCGLALHNDPPPRQILALARYLDGLVATPARVRSCLRLLTRGMAAQVHVHARGLVGLEIGDRAWTILLFEPLSDPAAVKVCRVCGCTQDLGCPGGCRWVTREMCSACDSFFASAAGCLRAP